MKKFNTTSFSLNDFLKLWKEQLQIEVVTGGKNLKQVITSPKIQKPGLRIIEKNIILDDGRIQILGNTEIEYIQKLSKKNQENLVKNLSTNNVPCFIFSNDLTPQSHLINLFKKYKIITFQSKLATGTLINSLDEILSERFAPSTTFHGVLMDIHRLGVLILGKSGIGKSECSIDLIIQGSKLIADDVVEIKKIDSNKLIGSGPENIRYLMEVRGVGIVNIKDLFGTTSVMDKREIEMVIELDQWDNEKEYDRLGIDEKTFNILEIELPYIIIPVSPGRNMASIIEVAVRNQILKNSGKSTIDNLGKNLLS
ncbi:MAG: HPr(Ser) kinase/phosphatase [Candidatus Dadabacteria bacterium]|nr:HPr(Ser) kinase/phosphatase [Candidatus Dadabacteria bacterium]NIQ15593.1 HPr(Ser) kinase/phosphatase [Candidatus Dadabacteria bacterium]